MNKPDLPNLTEAILIDLWIAWGKTIKLERFGQFVWNRCHFNRETWPELFYEKEGVEAYRMLSDYLESIKDVV